MILIRRLALASAMQGARNVYPLEFIALLRGEIKDGKGEAGKENVEVTEIVIPPLSEYGADFSSFNPWHVPSAMGIVGSFHSHPSGSGQPSHQDEIFFSKQGPLHLIGFPPFSLQSFRCYWKGKPAGVEIVD